MWCPPTGASASPARWRCWGWRWSLLSDRATGVAGLVAGCAAVAAYALPLKLNIVVAIAAAVAVGLLMDHARRAPSARRGDGT